MRVLRDFRVVVLSGTEQEWRDATKGQPCEVAELILKAVDRELRKQRRNGDNYDSIMIALPEEHIPGSMLNWTGRKTDGVLQRMKDHGGITFEAMP